MPNKPQIFTCRLGLATLMVIALSRSIAAQEAVREDPLSAPSASAAPSSTTDTQPSQGMPEPPIENAATAKPSLKYEPSERISEDSSVSFPVDI